MPFKFAILLLAIPMMLASQERKQDRPTDLDIPRSTLPGLRPAQVWGQPFDPMTKGEKFNYQIVDAFGRLSSATILASAAIDQWQNDPFEWGQGWDAFGQRAASRLGTRLVRRTVNLGLTILRHEDPRFFRSGEKRTWDRVKNQMKQTVLTRTDSGGVTFASGRVVGALVGAQVAQLWVPDSRDGVGINLQRGGWVVATDLGTRLLREFWPDIRKRVFRK